jgi:EmrB/QacA subfamily drug resistance transporter
MSTMLRDPCAEGCIRSAPEPPPRQKKHARTALAAAVLGSSMAFVDGTVVNVALPVMQRELGACVAQVQWIVEAYALMLAALLLVGGSLGDRFGRRRVFGVGVAVFAAASAWCGLAPDAAHLVLARGVQGLGGALLVPGSLALIGASFGAAERGRAIGTWSSLTAVAGGVGPVLGGLLVQHLSWRWIFFLNLPLAAAVLLLLPRVPESRDPRAGPLDLPGALLATLALGGIALGLTEAGPRGPGDPLVLALLAAGAAAALAFVRTERRSRAPMVPPELFRSRTFAGANLLTLLLYTALGATLFFLPFNLIQVQGYSPVQAGAALVPFTALMVLLSPRAGALVDRRGPRLPLVAGPLLAGAGIAGLALPGVGGSYWTTFFPGIVVMALGMTLSVAPLTTTVMGAVEMRRAGTASGINNAVSRTAALLSVAAMGVVMAGAFRPALRERLDALDLPPAARRELLAGADRLAAAPVPAGLDPRRAAAVERALDEAFVAGFRRVALLAAGLAAAGAASAFLLVDGRAPNRATSTGRAG